MPKRKQIIKKLIGLGIVRKAMDEYWIVATPEAIRSAAMAVATDDPKGQATTLQVKNLMRGEGYFIKQAQVSEVMTDLADSGELVAFRGPTYTYYELPKDDGPTAMIMVGVVTP